MNPRVNAAYESGGFGLPEGKPNAINHNTESGSELLRLTLPRASAIVELSQTRRPDPIH